MRAILSKHLQCPRSRSVRNYATPANLSRTPLYNLHKNLNAKFVPFAGYEMPLTYAWGGHVEEHNWTRNKAGLFDVSHMVQSKIKGQLGTGFLEYITPSALEPMKFTGTGTEESSGPFPAKLSVLLNDNGGVIDDLMITRWGEDLWYLVTNAGRRDVDLEHIRLELEKWNVDKGTTIEHEVMNDHALVALQGPEAANALQEFVTSSLDLNKLGFGSSAFAEFGSTKTRVHIARGGYTGEDGFEISIPALESVPVVNELLQNDKLVKPVGLAARDSLRIEAGLCLYGHDLDETINPVEANLRFVLRKKRQNYKGVDAVNEALDKGPKTQRVGLIVEKGAPARETAKLYNSNGDEIGVVSSGIPSPTLKQNIAMAYVRSGNEEPGTELQVDIRGKKKKATVTAMPFTPARYYRLKK